VSAGGYQTPAGNGNGSPPRRNRFAVGKSYPQCRAQLEARYPRLVATNFFPNLEAYMVVCDVEEDARYISGTTWLLRTPDDMEPSLFIYFTYGEEQVTLQAVWEA
jgi:hypothetical protein